MTARVQVPLRHPAAAGPTATSPPPWPDKFSTDPEEYARAAQALLLASPEENTVCLTMVDGVA